MRAPDMDSGRRPDPDCDSGRLICVGVIVGPVGVRGQVRIKSFCADPQDIADYQPLSDKHRSQRFQLRLVGAGKKTLVAAVRGVTTRDQAETLKGLQLYAERSRFPQAGPDEFYHADLIGLSVEDTDGNAIGCVKAVLNYGAGDLLEVLGEAGATQQIPFTEETVPVVDIAAGRAVVRWNEHER